MANNVKCCITFITHKSKLEGYEEKSLKQCIKIFGGNRTIKLVLPKSISTEYYDEYLDKVEILKVKDEWLDSLNSYNYMSCDKNFWKLFSEYEYVLIYQTDCWVFEDKLDHFIEMGYDWYGAPWPFWNNEVGNSGLCLRKVSKMLEITEKYTYRKASMHDDVWFCRIHKNEMNICPWEIAVNFSLETVSNKLLDAIKTIPMGFHGKKLIDLWDDDGNKFMKFKQSKKNNMKVALCCIGRLENQYAVEYVEYYKSIGFDKIFIYDNNHDDEEHFEDVLQPYIDDDFVTVIDFRNKEAAQLSAYNDCYSKYGNEYDWIAFFDFDEFLTLVKDKNIKSYLSHFDGFQGVKINWMVYTDNNLIKSDGRGVLERFTTPMEYDKCVTYKFPENNHTKSIIRCGIENLKWNQTPHTVLNIKYCNSIGDGCSNSPFESYNFDFAYIKHFTTKTIEEWINNKIKRGYPDGNKDWFKKNNIIDKFFKYNDITDEKNEYIKNNLQSSLKIYVCTHKEFEPVVHSNVYEVVNANDINDDTAPNGLKGSFYSELMTYKYIAENLELPKYVGFCCYRKYFYFLDDIPDIDKIFSEYDAICSKPKVFNNSIKSQYLNCHNIEDLYIVGGIIADRFPHLSKLWHNFINGNILIPYNMFIMKREDFKEYIDFIFYVLDEYLKIVGTDINKRIYDNYEKYIKKFYPNDSVEYQYRIGGYIAERCTNIFMMHKFKKIKTYPVIVTEDKYNQKNRTI